MHFYLAHLPEHNEAELAALNEFRGEITNPKPQCYNNCSNLNLTTCAIITSEDPEVTEGKNGF